jgi:hypothetical protein
MEIATIEYKRYFRSTGSKDKGALIFVYLIHCSKEQEDLRKQKFGRQYRIDHETGKPVLISDTPKTEGEYFMENGNIEFATESTNRKHDKTLPIQNMREL